MYILFLPRVGLYVSFLPLVDARGKTSYLPVVKTIYTYGFHELFLNLTTFDIKIIIYFPAKNNFMLVTPRTERYKGVQHILK